MICIMSMKQWDKYKKKLVQHKSYIIMDGTDDEDAKMSQYTNTITMDAFCPPSKLLKLMDDADLDDIIDIDRLEDLEKNYFEGLSLRNAILATVSGLLNEDINIFIVLRNKAFKYYKKRFRRIFIRLFDPNFEFVFILEDEYKKNRKMLDKDLSDTEKEELSKKLKKLEEKMVEEFEKKKKQKLRRRKKK